MKRQILNYLANRDFSLNLYKQFVWRFPIMPKQVRIEATKICNLKCIGCRRQFDGNIAIRAGEKYLSLPQMRFILDQYPSPMIFRFGGDGEPTVIPSFRDLLHEIKRQNLKFAFTTNGTLLTEELVKECRDCGMVKMSLSMNGGTKETFEKWREGAKWDNVIEGARRTSRNGIPLFLNFTMLTDELLEEVFDFIKVAKDVGSQGVQFLKPMIDYQYFTPPDFSQLGGLLSEIDAKVKEAGLLREGLLNPLPTFRQCYDPFTCPLVTLNGDVFPCSYTANQLATEWYEGEVINPHLENYVMGNVYRQSIKEIWEGSMFKELRQFIKDTSESVGEVISKDELVERRSKLDFDKEKFAYCRACLDRWSEAGS